MELIEPVQSSATNEVCQEFIAAIHHGDLTTAKKLIANQADLVNLVDGESDKTAFELALVGGMSSFARFLINTEPFDVNHEDHHPLRIAIDLGYLDLAAKQFCLKKGVILTTDLSTLAAHFCCVWKRSILSWQSLWLSTELKLIYVMTKGGHH